MSAPDRRIVRRAATVGAAGGEGGSMPTITLCIPLMTSRAAVRAVTAQIRDLAGVDSVAAEMASATVVVRGTITEPALRKAVADSGYVLADPPSS